MTTRAFAALLVLSAGCGQRDHASGGPAAAASAASSGPAATVVTPVDHLAPGELVDGTEQAFGLTLPRGVTVDSRLPGVVTARGPVAIKPLVTYLRDRLEGGSVRAHDDLSTTLEHVRPRGHSEPVLDVYIAPKLGGTLLQVVREPEIVPSTLPDEASRWRAVGLTPEGKVLDPNHTE